MVQSTATTVEAYLNELPEERREVMSELRALVVANLPEGYEETMRWGMISYEIPLERYPDTYNGQPLGYIGLAAQKRHYALYLMAVYQDPELEARLREAFDAAGKKIDLGKSCLRLRTLEGVPLDAIAEVVASVPPEDYIARYEAARKT